jgi:hypothetical protein
VTSLVLTLLLVWLGVTVLLAAWTLLVQGYLYEGPVEQLWWRAPAAGASLALFFGLWAFLAMRTPGRYDILTEFSAQEVRGPFKEMTVTTPDGKEETYKPRRGADGRVRYFRDGRPMPSRPGRIMVTEDGQKAVFLPDRDVAGLYRVARDKTPFGDVEGSLHYRDERGRVMTEDSLGYISVYHPGWLAANLALNFLHLAVWFFCLWLLLLFHWPHALGQAAVAWVAAMLFVVPFLLARAEALARR